MAATTSTGVYNIESKSTRRLESHLNPTSKGNDEQSNDKKRPNITGNGKSSAKSRPTTKPKSWSAIKPPFALYESCLRPTFEEGFSTVAKWLKGAKRICVIGGAGMSVSCGIPDFRSPSDGLYSTLNCRELGLSCPEDLFDFDSFKHNPSSFYQFAAKHFWTTAIHQNNNHQGIMPSDSHNFLRRLETAKKLRRVYTQNMDGLEEKAGLSSNKVVYAHGSLRYATCLTCKRRVLTKDIITDQVLAGQVARCQAHKSSSQVSAETRRKRINSKTQSFSSTTIPSQISSFDEDIPKSTRKSTRKRTRPDIYHDTISSDFFLPNWPVSCVGSTNNDYDCESTACCNGIMKPCITFFGEPLNDQVGRFLKSDREKVDAVIVIGTSLSVAPISKVVSYLPSNIPRILINRTIVDVPTAAMPQRQQMNSCIADHDDLDDKSEDQDFRVNYGFDAYLLGNSDDIVRALAKLVFPEDYEDLCASHNCALQSENNNHITEPGTLLWSLLSDNYGENDGNHGICDSHNRTKKSSSVIGHPADWANVSVPHDRVFLFPGAQPNSSLSNNVKSDTKKTPYEKRSNKESDIVEIAHCNHCQEQIAHGGIHKCVECFDYDLCATCFPIISKTHFTGEHSFQAE